MIGARGRWRRAALCRAAAAVALAGCAPAGDAPLLLDVTAEVGLDATREPWPPGTYAAPEIMGPGVALLDADGDADLDLVQLRMRGTNRLFEQVDGRFVERPGSGLEDGGFAQGVAVGDPNGDGHADVFFANYGADTLYLGNGDGTFRRLDGATFGEPAWSSGATFCDYDGDGDEDLYVVRYLDFDPSVECLGNSGVRDFCAPAAFDGVTDELFVNDRGTLVPAGARVGLTYPDGGRTAKGLAVLCADLTGDGRLDFYVANDLQPNNLWVGAPDGSLRDDAALVGVAVNRHGDPEASMGLAAGDVDGDGHADLFATHLDGETNTFYRGGPRAVFRDATPEAGTGPHDLARTGFGCALADLDHDGDLDLAVVNGRVALGEPLPDAPYDRFWNRYAEPNLLFLNEGDGTYRGADTRAGRFGEHVEVSRGLAQGDLDGDGDVDLVVSNGDGSVRAFRNEAPTAGTHWLSLVPHDRYGPALGARVEMRAGDRSFVGFVLRNRSYQSAGDPAVHFGLGTLAAVDGVTVVWTDGQREAFELAGIDRRVVLNRGTGSPR